MDHNLKASVGCGYFVGLLSLFLPYLEMFMFTCNHLFETCFAFLVWPELYLMCNFLCLLIFIPHVSCVGFQSRFSHRSVGYGFHITDHVLFGLSSRRVFSLEISLSFMPFLVNIDWFLSKKWNFIFSKFYFDLLTYTKFKLKTVDLYQESCSQMHYNRGPLLFSLQCSV